MKVEMIPKWSHSSCSLFSKVFWRIVLWVVFQDFELKSITLLMLCNTQKRHNFFHKTSLIPLLSKNNSFSSFNFEMDFFDVPSIVWADRSKFTWNTFLSRDSSKFIIWKGQIQKFILVLNFEIAQKSHSELSVYGFRSAAPKY